VAIIRFKSKIEQVAECLKGELLRGRWGDRIPGRDALAKELGVNSKTVESALRLLEHEELLVAEGVGKKRRIVLPTHVDPPSLRVAVLKYDPEVRGENFMVNLLHLLTEAGHIAFSTSQTLLGMGMKVERVAKLVEKTPADAWVVVSGSREVLEWFAAQAAPAYALFGRRRELPIAGGGPDKIPAMRELTRDLLELGHQRIVLLVRRERRLPQPGALERAFLTTLEAHGLRPTNYHFPDWEENIEGFHRALEKLFQFTPPTAVIVDEASFFTAAMQFCLNRGLRVPEQVSLVCCDSDPNFTWCKPSITHIQWDSWAVAKPVVSWASNISRGRNDRRQVETKAEYIKGGTIGPAFRG